jgi:putative transposase
MQKLKMVKKIKNRESRIVRDLNHKVSRKIVNFARENNAGIVLEDLKGIRETKKQAKSFKYSLHSWSFSQLDSFIEYKAKLLGILVVKIDPRYTSQQCSRCGLLGERKGKSFKCSCGHVEDADVNASFVIGLRHQGILLLPKDRVLGKGNTDIPQGATA